MSLLRKLPVRSGGGGIWDQLAADLPNPVSLDEGMGLWAQISVQPGGLWQEARNETLLLRTRLNDKDSVWDEVNNETLVLDGDRGRSVWEDAQGALADLPVGDGQRANLWDEVHDETLILSRPQEIGWMGPKVRHSTHFRPVRALGWALKKLETTRGEEYYVLKNLRRGTYLKLNEQQVYVWNLMDGSYSVEDLAVAIFIRYKTFSFEWLIAWLGQLKAAGFLTADGVNVYQAGRQQLFQRTLGFWGLRLINLLFRSEVSVKGVDQFYAAIYKLLGRILYSRPVQVLLLLITLAGLPAFFYVAPEGGLGAFFGAGGSMQTGLVSLLISQIVLIFVHESAHALTTKRYGRVVRRGGVGLYFGMVAFFMDTTDIWMEPRGPRLAVTWAGPYSGFILGGMASLLMLLDPTAAWVGFLYQFAVIGYFISVVNLNPLLKLDGYYLLMDWLEIPRLRERSIAFVRTELWGKLSRRESFDREERIFLVFGALVILWTAFFILSALRLYGSSLATAIQGFLTQTEQG